MSFVLITETKTSYEESPSVYTCSSFIIYKKIVYGWQYKRSHVRFITYYEFCICVRRKTKYTKYYIREALSSPVSICNLQWKKCDMLIEHIMMTTYFNRLDMKYTNGHFLQQKNVDLYKLIYECTGIVNDVIPIILKYIFIN
jgi:hypothetical protein